MITLALSKGRIFEETLPLLRVAGIEVTDTAEGPQWALLGQAGGQERSDAGIVGRN